MIAELIKPFCIAIVYDMNEPLAIELIEEATHIGGLTERFLLAFVIAESAKGRKSVGHGRLRQLFERPFRSKQTFVCSAG